MNNQPTRPDKNPDFDPDQAYSDMSDDFGLGSDRSDEAPDSGFDVGTSPHGLSAGLQGTHQETSEAACSHPPAKPVLTFSLTEEQLDDVKFAVMCKAEFLEESDEYHEVEVQQAISNLWDAYKELNGGRYE